MIGEHCLHDPMIIRRAQLRRLLVSFSVLFVFVLMFFFHVSILRTAGWALVAEDPLSKSDVVVVPRWAGDAGALEAADLVHAGVAPRVAVLTGPSVRAEEELARRGIVTPEAATRLTQLTRSLGVQEVEEVQNPINGTEAEGEFLPEWTNLHGFHSIIVITTADHSRRVRRVLHRSMKGHNVNVLIRSARYSGFDPDRWWETRDGTRTEVVELQKLLFDIIRHPIS